MKIILLLIIIIAVLSKFDPCGYVGSSNDPSLEEKCLDASPDCCFYAWQFENYVYYSCSSRSKLIAQRKDFNLTDSFIYDLQDDHLYKSIASNIYSKCNNEQDVNTHNKDREPPKIIQYRGLYNSKHDDL